jgi:hypothetical protein
MTNSLYTKLKKYKTYKTLCKIKRIKFKDFREWIKNPLNETVSLPIKVGDTILVGRFKNKPIKIKNIGFDEYGLPVINGRKAVTFRLKKDKPKNESELVEMPHIAEKKINVDLSIEEYPITDERKKMFLKSFYNGEGVYGEKDGKWYCFSAKHSYKINYKPKSSDLILPDFWTKYIRGKIEENVNESLSIKSGRNGEIVYKWQNHYHPDNPNFMQVVRWTAYEKPNKTITYGYDLGASGKWKVVKHNASFTGDAKKFVESLINSQGKFIDEDAVFGGKGDEKLDSEFNQYELDLGELVEMEHTSDPKIAREIAKDHLAENPHYYSLLMKSGVVDEKEAIDFFNKNKEFFIESKINIKKIIREELKKVINEGKEKVDQGRYNGVPYEIYEISVFSLKGSTVSYFAIINYNQKIDLPDSGNKNQALMHLKKHIDSVRKNPGSKEIETMPKFKKAVTISGFDDVLEFNKTKHGSVLRWEVITYRKWNEKTAQNFQAKQGYHPGGYDFFNFKKEEKLNKTFKYTWESYSVS